MLKNGILNPQIANVLASIGHMDMLVISDAGLPLPLEVERIDLAWKAYEPGLVDVLDEVLKNIVVEKVILAEEIKTDNLEILSKIIKILPKKVEIEYVPHTQLKELTKESRAIIRTGEFTHYPSIILVAGCAY